MDSLLVKYFDDKGMKASSRDLAVSQIGKIISLIYDDVDKVTSLLQVKEMMKDYDLIFKAIDGYQGARGQIGISTKLSYVNSFIHLTQMIGLKEARDFFQEKQSSLQTKRDHESIHTPKLKGMTREQLDEFVNYYKDKSIKDYLRVLIMSTYPFRSETSTLESISKEDHDELSEAGQLGIRNFVIVDDKNDKLSFEFNGYKTKSKHGTRTIPIEDQEIREVMIKYLSLIGENDFLFHTGTRSSTYDESMTETKIQAKQRNNLSSWTKKSIKKVIGIDASMTDITKVLIDELWLNPKTPPEKLIQFAMWRGHETKTAATVYVTS